MSIGASASSSRTVRMQVAYPIASNFRVREGMSGSFRTSWLNFPAWQSWIEGRDESEITRKWGMGSPVVALRHISG